MDLESRKILLSPSQFPVDIVRPVVQQTAARMEMATVMTHEHPDGRFMPLLDKVAVEVRGSSVQIGETAFAGFVKAERPGFPPERPDNFAEVVVDVYDNPPELTHPIFIGSIATAPETAVSLFLPREDAFGFHRQDLPNGIWLHFDRPQIDKPGSCVGVSAGYTVFENRRDVLRRVHDEGFLSAGSTTRTADGVWPQLTKTRIGIADSQSQLPTERWVNAAQYVDVLRLVNSTVDIGNSQLVDELATDTSENRVRGYAAVVGKFWRVLNERLVS